MGSTQWSSSKMVAVPVGFLRGCHFVKSAEASKEVNKNTIYDLNMGEG